ncbi:MAG: hypothetical protein ACFCUX_01565 [Candidatus Methylacidiphilales bacterium]
MKWLSQLSRSGLYVPLILTTLTALTPPLTLGQNIPLRDAAVATLRDSRQNDIPADITGRLEGFFAKLLRDTPETAFFTLFQGTSFQDKREVIDQITATSKGSVEAFGAYTQHEFTGVQRFGEKSLVISYQTEMPKKLLRWRFYFYSTGGTDWVLANIKVDDYRNHLPRQANPQPPPAEIQLSIEKFFVNIQSQRSRAAMSELLSGSAVPGYENSLEDSIKMVDTALENFGDLKAYELFDRTALGSRYILLTYFAYHEAEPMRWQFIYRQDRPGEWLLFNVRFDDLLDEAVLVD